MEIRTLRYFLAIAKEENMTKAADILHVTQPTLSKTPQAMYDGLKNYAQNEAKIFESLIFDDKQQIVWVLW